MPAHSQLVLHHLVMKGIADRDALSTCTGLGDQELAAGVADLLDEALILERTGRISGFAPTPAGRRAHASAIEHDPLRARRGELADWYSRFELINAEFKELCTAWQLIDGERINDHADAAYDAAIVARLADLHARTGGLICEVADERLGRYLARLTDAEQAIVSGDARRLTAPLCESYHDVWMELHHDLITSFGRARTAADA